MSARRVCKEFRFFDAKNKRKDFYSSGAKSSPASTAKNRALVGDAD